LSCPSSYSSTRSLTLQRANPRPLLHRLAPLPRPCPAGRKIRRPCHLRRQLFLLLCRLPQVSQSFLEPPSPSEANYHPPRDSCNSTLAHSLHQYIYHLPFIFQSLISQPALDSHPCLIRRTSRVNRVGKVRYSLTNIYQTFILFSHSQS